MPPQTRHTMNSTSQLTAVFKMMLGEPHRPPPNPTVGIPPWPPNDDPTDEIYSPLSPENYHASGDLTAVVASSLIDSNNNSYHLQDLVMALGRYLPSNEQQDNDYDAELLQLHGGGECDGPVDAYSCDQFRMYEFKVKRCTRGRSHDWTECPFAHPGEKARRRDPRRYHYSGTACPEYRKGSCKKGDACEFAHGVFECWLHPARYRTQPCKDGVNCRRRVCFFAHTPDQLRVVSHQPSPNPSPRNVNSADVDVPFCKTIPFMAPPITISPDDSPPVSPMTRSLSRSLGSNSIKEMVASLRNMQLDKVKSLPTSWGVNQAIGSGYGSPRGSGIRPGFRSMPTTPTTNLGRLGLGYLDMWEMGGVKEPVMERVESGRDLRTKMFEKLSKENTLDQAGDGSLGPDVGWVSDLVK